MRVLRQFVEQAGLAFAILFWLPNASEMKLRAAQFIGVAIVIDLAIFTLFFSNPLGQLFYLPIQIQSILDNYLSFLPGFSNPILAIALFLVLPIFVISTVVCLALTIGRISISEIARASVMLGALVAPIFFLLALREVANADSGYLSLAIVPALIWWILRTAEIAQPEAHWWPTLVFRIAIGFALALSIWMSSQLALGAHRIVGDGGEPTIRSGELFVSSRARPALEGIRRGDVVFYFADMGEGVEGIKVGRVIGVPGDRVFWSATTSVGVSDSNGRDVLTLVGTYPDSRNGSDLAAYHIITRNGEPPVCFHVIEGAFVFSQGSTSLDHDQYFIAGDNRPISHDSRVTGPIERRNIRSVVVSQLTPRARQSPAPNVPPHIAEQCPSRASR